MTKNTIACLLTVAAASFGAQGCTNGTGSADGFVDEGPSGASIDDEGNAGTNAQALTAGGAMAQALAADGTEVAAIATRAGSRVRFVAGSDGELGFGIIGAIGAVDAELEAAKRRAGDDPVKFYEALAGRAAPASLVAAKDRASDENQLRGALPFDDGATEAFGAADGDAGAAGGSASPGLGLVGPSNPLASGNLCDITNWVYKGSNAFIYCWPNQYSTPWVKRKADHLSCRIDAVQGGIRVWYKYWTAGGSHKPIDAWLSAGQYMEWHGYYVWARRYRECKTVENPSGKKHHFRVAGHEYMAPLGFNPISVNFPDP